MIDSWKIKNNVISQIIIDNINVIYPWGAETADSSTFFSFEKNVGWRYEIMSEKIRKGDNYQYRKFIIKSKEGAWQISSLDRLIDNYKIRRIIKLRCIKDSMFMDFVLRYRFNKDVFHSSKISGFEFVHTDSNIYYQYPVKEAELTGNDYNVKILLSKAQYPDSFSQKMYVRDNFNEWVVHIRLLPNKWEKEVIKICKSWSGTRPLPQFISRRLLNFQGIKESLWYRSENSPYKSRLLRLFNFNAYPLVKLKKGDEILIDAICEFRYV